MKYLHLKIKIAEKKSFNYFHVNDYFRKSSTVSIKADIRYNIALETITYYSIYILEMQKMEE